MQTHTDVEEKVQENSLSMKDLLEAGAHFGHRFSNWDPRMERFVFTKRKGVHIINLQKTVLFYEQAYNYAKNVAANGGRLLIVGTKKQAKKIVEDNARRIGEFYITNRWIGGLLTNFGTVSKSIAKLEKLKAFFEDKEKQKGYLKRDMVKMKKHMEKLQETFGGIIDMKKAPELIFVVDAFFEKNCITEANLMNIPICAVVDTNSNPDNVEMVIPANDDAVRSIALFVDGITRAFEQGKKSYQETHSERIALTSEGETLADDAAKAKGQATGAPAAEKSAGATAKISAVADKTPAAKSKGETAGTLAAEKKAPAEKAKSETAKSETSKGDTVAKSAKAEKSATAATAEKKSATTSKKSAAEKPAKAEKPAEKKSTADKTSADSADGAVSAKKVKELREATNVSMMECKKALVKANGDFDEAIRLLKEKGLSLVEKKSSRDAKEGAIAMTGTDKKKVILKLASETDFVAKNENFVKLAQDICQEAFSKGEEIKENPETKEKIAELTTKLGEKIVIGEIEVLETKQGYLGAYLHSNKKIAAVVEIVDEKNQPLSENETLKQLGADLAMQVTAMSPLAVSSKDISEEVKKQEKEIFLKQMEKEDKPADVKEKIVEGKLKKHFAEKCLLEMNFVKEAKMSVGDYIKKISKDLSLSLTVKSFKRISIG